LTINKKDLQVAMGNKAGDQFLMQEQKKMSKLRKIQI